MHKGATVDRVRFDQLSDEELITSARTGDEKSLLTLLDRYRRLTRAKASSFFLVGADREDLIQEGMIGLYKAIRDYSATHGTPFRPFAEMCVGRQILTAIKASTRFKHGPLNGYVSMSRSLLADDHDQRLVADLFAHPAGSDPADLVISAERIRALQVHLDEVLSDLEAEVLRLYVDGKSYTEIATLLRRHVKSIDNALQRIKRKLDLHLRDRDVAEAG